MKYTKSCLLLGAVLALASSIVSPVKAQVVDEVDRSRVNSAARMVDESLAWARKSSPGSQSFVSAVNQAERSLSDYERVVADTAMANDGKVLGEIRAKRAELKSLMEWHDSELASASQAEEKKKEKALADALAYSGPIAKAPIEFVRMKVEEGDEWAMLELAQRFKEGERGAFYSDKNYRIYLKKAATLGNAQANFLLGRTFGILGQAEDGRAVPYYEKASEKNHAEATYRLGMMLMAGYATEFDQVKDEEKGGRLIQKAANLGNLGAYLTLARMYEKGRGGAPSDPDKSCYWMSVYYDVSDGNRWAANTRDQVRMALRNWKSQHGEERFAECRAQAGKWKPDVSYEQEHGFLAGGG